MHRARERTIDDGRPMLRGFPHPLPLPLPLSLSLTSQSRNGKENCHGDRGDYGHIPFLRDISTCYLNVKTETGYLEVWKGKAVVPQSW
jgi:hypothetical protein